MKILVASKVGFIRHNLQHCLREDGHRIATAESQLKLLEMVGCDSQIGIVITDCAPVGMSANEVIKAIRRVDRMSDEGNVAAPYVIVLANKTNRSDNEIDAKDTEGGFALAFGEVLIKPINMQLLRKRICDIVKMETPASPVNVTKAPIVSNPVAAGVACDMAVPPLDELDLSMLIENAYIR